MERKELNQKKFVGQYTKSSLMALRGFYFKAVFNKKGSNKMMKEINLFYLLALPFLSFGQSFTSSYLPIIHIETQGNTIVDEPKVVASMGIIDNGPGQLNQVGEPFTGYQGAIGIEFRGNSTQDADKKSYGIELWTAQGADTSASLLGMPSEEDWVLHASHFDKTFLRNVLSYEIWQKMGYWASRSRFCELIIDGDYRGVYILMEKVKRDKNRLNIAKLKPDDLQGDDLTGGYLIRLDWSEGPGWFSHFEAMREGPLEFQYEYPKARSITLEQQQYIQAYIDSFETALFSPSYHHPSGLRYHQLADLASFVDLFIVNELSRSVDAYKLSSYIHKDKNSRGGLLKAGPIWDFDLAYDNAAYCGGNRPDGWTYQQAESSCDDLVKMPRWWERLMADTMFTRQLRSRWVTLRSTFLHPDSLTLRIDQYATLLQEAQARNFERWEVLEENLFAQPEPLPGSYAGEINRLKTWMRDRIQWLDNHIPGTCDGDTLRTLEKALPNRPFPNPSTGWLYLKTDANTPILLTLHDLTGKTLMRRTGASILPEEVIFLDLSSFTSGLYFLKIYYPQKADVHKIVLRP